MENKSENLLKFLAQTKKEKICYLVLQYTL